MNNSKLLLDEEPLIVMPQLACKIGLNESIVLQQIHYWIEINKKADKNFKDNHYWTFNSYEEWHKQFPFWSIITIKRIIKNLEKANLLITANYNQMKIDRTKWYRINYEELESLENSPLYQNDIMDDIKMIQPIPEINQKRVKNKSHKHNKKFTKKQLEAVSDLAKIEALNKTGDRICL